MNIKHILGSKTAYIAAVVYTAAMIFVCLQEIDPSVDLSFIDFFVPQDFNERDKLAHVILHGAFVVIWSVARVPKSKYILLLASFVLGLFIEVSQGLFTTTRFFDLLDIVANSVGAVLGSLFFYYFLLKKVFN